MISEQYLYVHVLMFYETLSSIFEKDVVILINQGFDILKNVFYFSTSLVV